MNIRTDEDVQTMFNVHEQVQAFTKCIELFVDVVNSVSGDVNRLDRGHMMLGEGTSNVNNTFYSEYATANEYTDIDRNAGFDLNIAPTTDRFDLNSEPWIDEIVANTTEVPVTLHMTMMNELGNIYCIYV